MPQKQSEAFHTFLWHFFSKFKTQFYCISFFLSVLTSRLHFKTDQLWQSGFSRVYSNCCCRCSFEPEIIKISQSSHNMYSNNTVYFQESTTISNTHTKKSENLLKTPRINIYYLMFIVYITRGKKNMDTLLFLQSKLEIWPITFHCSTTELLLEKFQQKLWKIF